MKRTGLDSIAEQDRRLGRGFMLPGILFLVILIIIPICYALYMSFFEWKIFDLGKGKAFVGMQNYIRLFSDALFRKSIKNTVVITLVSLLIEIPLGTLIAIALWNMQRKMKLVHSIILLPMITSPVIVALLWRYIYDPQFGLLNYVLSGLFQISNIAWLGDANYVIPSIITVDVWQMTSFVVLIMYASLTVVPMHAIEAAQVDGASYPQIVRYIVLPFIFPTIVLVAMLRTMDLLKIFDTVYVLTKGGPSSASETLSTYIYKTGFQYYDMGYSMTLSLITLACILVISLGYLRAIKPRGRG